MSRISPPKRAIAVSVAVLLAAVATFALVSYVRGVEAEVAEANESVQAYVAKDVIAQGTTGEDAVSSGLIVSEDIPRRLLAEGAVSSLDQISGRVASADVLPGEQIIAGRFVVPDDLSSELLNIPENRQAMSIEVDVPSGVSQFIQRGSRVSLIAELSVSNGSSDAPAAGQPAANQQQNVRSKYLLQNLEVLAVGQRLVTTTTGEGEDQVEQTQDRVLLTLAVNPEEAEKLTLAIFEGRVYFTLLPPDQEPVETSGQTLDTIFD